VLLPLGLDSGHCYSPCSNLVKNIALRIAALVAAISFSGCSVFRPGWVAESSFPVQQRADNEVVEGVDGPTGGHFDDEGNWIPDNPEIPLTYQIPDISAGMVFDIHTLDVTPIVSVELFEVDTHVPYLRSLKFDVGVGYQRTFLYVGKKWTNIFEISTGGFIGYNWDDNDISYGVGFTLIKF
jgi:hypothetical protein